MSTVQSLEDVSDKQRLKQAFLRLRERGYWAREQQRGGFKAVPEDIIKRGTSWVLYDEHEDGAFDPGGNLRRDLHLHHLSRDAQEIARFMREYGFTAVVIDGPKGEKEVVLRPPNGVA